MQRPSRLIHASPSRNVIVEMKNALKIGEPVAGEKLRHLGKIFDVFSPISSPHVAVEPQI